MKTPHILSADQFTPERLGDLFTITTRFREDVGFNRHTSLQSRLAGQHMISFFFEPSTRTRVSHEMAAQRLGMIVTSTENAGEFSSTVKGESLADSIAVLCEYRPDVIVLRHPETGSAKIAAAVADSYDVPIINAGDGKGEHPTQAFLDAFTIFQKFGRLDNLTILLGGDLANGRTGRSLCRLLAKYPGNSFIFLAPESLQMKSDIRDLLTTNGLKWRTAINKEDAFSGHPDVIYWTRVQKERMKLIERLAHRFCDRSAYRLDKAALGMMKGDCIIMHPLPRVDEISLEVDKDLRAGYFKQSGNGMYCRMALLYDMLGKAE